MLRKARQFQIFQFAVTLLVCGALLVLWRPCEAGPLTWEAKTIPTDGSIVGAPGETIGWGYAISNNSSGWLLPSSLDADPFSFGTTQAIFDFPLLAPGQSVSVAFAPGLQGLFEFTWDTNAPTGSSNAGLFTLTVDLYSDNPFLGGSLVTTEFTELPYLAVVPMPEPGALLLATTALVLAAFVQIRRPRRWRLRQ